MAKFFLVEVRSYTAEVASVALERAEFHSLKLATKCFQRHAAKHVRDVDVTVDLSSPGSTPASRTTLAVKYRKARHVEFHATYYDWIDVAGGQ